MLVVLLLMVVKMMVVVVMLQRHPVVTQPVLGWLGHGLKHPSHSPDTSLCLHELCDGRAVLLLVSAWGTLQQARNNICSIFHSLDSSIRGHISARVHCIIVGECASYRRARYFSRWWSQCWSICKRVRVRFSWTLLRAKQSSQRKRLGLSTFIVLDERSTVE